MEIKSRAELENYLAYEWKNNPEFRELLKANPREAIEKLMGQKIPKECNFHIVEDHGLDFTLVIPQESKEVEATLAGVSGGATAIEYGLIPGLVGIGTLPNLGNFKFP